jgi:hypothetical protein
MLIGLQGEVALSASQVAEAHAEIRMLQSAGGDDPAARHQCRLLELRAGGLQRELEQLREALAAEARGRVQEARGRQEAEAQLGRAQAKVRSQRIRGREGKTEREGACACVRA